MNEGTVEAVLSGFCAEMRKWEIECARRDVDCERGLTDYDEAERIGMNEYSRIFSRFCSEKATPRDFHYSEPPEYDPDHQTIEEIQNADDESVRVYTRMISGLNERFVFSLVREGGFWRIKGKCFLSDDGDLIDANL